jgi:hypothetical protein
MYNTNIPSRSELPSSKKLWRSTVLALVVAIALLVTVVLPSEYAIDPTGIGRMLGLTEMGEIKAQLAEEAALDAAMDAVNQAPAQTDDRGEVATSAATAPEAPVSPAGEGWQDEMQVVLAPGQGAEIKLSMKAGERAEFSWVVQGGTVNFDTHGDGGGQSISYEKGRSVPSANGVIEAAFDGNHGWFWRNRGNADVTVVVRARGQYAEMKRVI